MNFPKRDLGEAKFVDSLSSEQKMWLARAFHHAGEDAQLTTSTLFDKAGVFDPEVLRQYNAFCKDSHEQGAESLSAQTFRKGEPISARHCFDVTSFF